MLDWLLRIFVRSVLSLRYRIRVRGLSDVAARGRRGVLFLPNHPALIDPVIMLSVLQKDFAPRALADRDQIDRFFIRWLARRTGVQPISDMVRHGVGARGQIEAVVHDCIDILKRGHNLMLYPSGHIYRSRLEDLRGNSAVESILSTLPDVRVVLVRTRGLWGSAFSHAGGTAPRVADVLLRGALRVLANFVFFSPRRDVSIELTEPRDLPRTGGRAALNEYMERFYNEDAPPNTYVPYTIWERGGRRELPDPPLDTMNGDATDVPPATRALVLAHLCELTGQKDLRDHQRLAYDLGLDSLARAELMLWLGREFGFQVGDVASLQTVGDVMLAARGQVGSGRPVELKPVPPRWFADPGPARAQIPSGPAITDVFLRQARRGPGRVAVADQLSGAKTYRELVTAILVLKPIIEALPGERVGIMLPASVAATTVYFATLFARKEPVLVNWTTGTRNIVHALDLTGVRAVLTAGPLVARIQSQGLDLQPLRDRLVMLESLTGKISRSAKLSALLRGYLSWGSLDAVRVPANAAILLTSGSEAMPKAVPLTHANLLSNVRDVADTWTIYERDRLIGFLPPFHSFGLTVTMLLPLLGGVRVVYHPDPTEAWVLTRLIEAFKATIVVGTPTFLNSILRAAKGAELATLRIAVSGAEKCSDRIYQAFAERCPNAVILEGYGVTECAPIVAANRQDRARPGTIGQMLPSFEHAIVDPDTGRAVRPGEPGMLLVRGPSVFSGYLGQEGGGPFVEFAGKRWYRTGDLVVADTEGVLTFRGRLKRFVKLGGEMVSLPAIESVLEQRYASSTDDGPTLAVEATPSEEHPEIVLFTTRDIDRAAANTYIRDAQLSPLHNITRVVKVETIPVLGTGKTDYRALKALLSEKQ